MFKSTKESAGGASFLKSSFKQFQERTKMKNALLYARIIFLFSIVAFISNTNTFGKEVIEAGAGPESLTKSFSPINQMVPINVSAATNISYPNESLLFTISDIVFFSYCDGTMLELYNSSGTLIWNNGGLPLNKGGHVNITVSQGIYRARGSQKFSVLTGDPITRNVVGYYAMDQDGFGASKEIYTWVPSLYSHCKFAVFAYEDDTAINVEYTDTGTDIASVTLNAGQHWDIETLSAKWLHITADKPVSALTCYDQGYFVPSSTGRWSGKKFYTYVNDIMSWPEDLSIFAFEDNTDVTITNTTTSAVIWSGTLNSGQTHVQSYPSGANIFFTITSSKDVTVSVQPWVSMTSSYNQGAYVQDRSGSGIGTDLIASTLNDGYLYILSYNDATNIDIYDSRTNSFIANYTLNKGESVQANPGSGLWRIIASNNVSAYSGYGTFNADFAPVQFGKATNPLNLSKIPSNDTVPPGGVVTYTISFDNAENDDTVHNVQLIDELPLELSNVNEISNGGDYNDVTHSVRWNVGDLPGYAAQQIRTFKATIASDTLYGTIITNYATINGDEIPPSTTSVDVLVSNIDSFKLDAPIMGSTRAFLQWGAYGSYDEYRYKIHIERKDLFPPTVREIEYDADNEEIRIPKFIVDELKSDLNPLDYNYKFYVEAIDSNDNVAAKSNTVEGKTTDKGNIPVPANPIVLVPGVGSQFNDKHFNKVRGIFWELGWKDAKVAGVEYSNGYTSDTIPTNIKWVNNQVPAKYNEISVFTFVPYDPRSDYPDLHEVGIEQKGIELGYFLKYLENNSKSNFQLVGHSLGGLTCRAYIQRAIEPISYSHNVARLVTTGTPNNGVLDDRSSYEAKGYYGVKQIALEGYFEDWWRKDAYRLFKLDPLMTDLEIKAELDILFCYLQFGFPIIGGGGWDFDGQTLYGSWTDSHYTPADVLYDSPFLHDLSTYEDHQVFGDLPNMQYASIVNRCDILSIYGPLLWPLNGYLGYGFDGDGIVSMNSQNLSLISTNLPKQRSVRIINRMENHKDEEDDFIGILMGLGYPVLSFKSASPVDLLITAPSGQYITKGDSAMFLASYTEIYEEGHDTPSDLVEIPFPEQGEYNVEVIPDPNTDPNATYSLTMTRGEVTTVLADNVKISDIPQEPYQIASSSVQAKKCKVTAGKGINVHKDSFTFVGTSDINSAEFSLANDVTVRIGGVYLESIPVSSFIVKNGKYTYTYKIPKGGQGKITSLVIDTSKHTFSLKAKKIDLTGLHCPFNVELEIGNYWGVCTLDENIVNAKRFIPVQLMTSVEDYLQIQSVKVRQGTLTDTLTVKGGIALQNPLSPINDVNLCNVDLGLNLGEQTFTIPAGSFKSSGRSGLKFVCKNAVISGGIANATFDFGKCTFTINIKNTKINSKSGAVGVSLNMGSFDEQVNFDLDTGQTIY